MLNPRKSLNSHGKQVNSQFNTRRGFSLFLSHELKMFALFFAWGLRIIFRVFRYIENYVVPWRVENSTWVLFGRGACTRALDPGTAQCAFPPPLLSQIRSQLSSSLIIAAGAIVLYNFIFRIIFKLVHSKSKQFTVKRAANLYIDPSKSTITRTLCN